MDAKPVMPMTPVTSSKLKEIGYDEPSKTLAVKFTRATYHYAAVPPEIFKGLREAESCGKFFSENIQGKFSFTKLVEQPEEE